MRQIFVQYASSDLLGGKKKKSDWKAVELHISSPFKITYMKLILA